MSDIDTVAEAIYDSLYINPTLPKPLPFNQLLASDAARFRRMAQAAIDALQLGEQIDPIRCYDPTCAWDFGCGHDSRQRRLVGPWVQVQEQP